MNYNFIEKVIEEFNILKNEYVINYTLHTNGLLLDVMPNIIIDNISLIMLSINYEKIPKFNLSNSYFSNIIDNISYIKSKKNIDILARLTITSQTSLYTTSQQISSFVDGIYWQIENTHKLKRFTKNYCYELELLFKYWFSYYKKGVMLNFIPFIAQLNFLISPLNSNKSLCGFNDFSIYIQTNGICYSCAEETDNNDYRIGEINKDFEFNNTTISDYKKCHDCTYVMRCFGRCSRMHNEFSDDEIEKYCIMTKKLIDLFEINKDIILEIYDKNKHFNAQLSDLNHMLSHTEYLP